MVGKQVKKGTREMTEYLNFWFAKIVVEMVVAAVLIGILLVVFFISIWIKRKAQQND